MTGNQLIDKLQNITLENILFVEKKIQYLTTDQLNWKPNASSWSLNEVFAHLNAYGDFYHESFSKIISKTKHQTPTENFISSPLGSAAWKSMKLGKANNVKRKYRSNSAYNPSSNPELVNGKDWSTFLESQQELTTLLDMARLVNIKRAKTALSVSKIIKFRLGDALSYVVYHNERHLQQVKNILAHSNFPKKK